ncbi:serine/threonine-protein kinase [Flindersiella endophytica]
MQGDFQVEGYVIEGLLGAGSTGELWLAREQASGQQVALKRFRPRDEEAQREARRMVNTLAQLSHPNLLPVREMVSLGEYFVIIFDYPEGGTLDQLLTVRGTLHPGEMVTIASAIADALATVHQIGLVHGDVNPESVVFAADGRPLLTDVGVMGLIERDQLLGTHGFTDPATLAEDAGPPTAASDVYGLAAVCYIALSGTTLDSQQQRRPLHQIAPGVPPGLAHAVEAGLQADPSARPSAGSFGGQLMSAAPAATVRFPEGGLGQAPFALPDAGDQFVIGTDPAQGPQNPQQSPPQQPPQGSPGLFARETPLAEPSTSFTPQASRLTFDDDEDDDRDERRERKRRRKQQKASRQQAARQQQATAQQEAPAEPRPKTGLPLPRNALLAIAAGVVLVLLVGGFFALRAITGPDESGGPKLAGPNAEKWSGVLDSLDELISAAYQAGDPKQLEAAYKPGSLALKEDQHTMQAFLLDQGWQGAKGFHAETLELTVTEESDTKVVLNAVLQRQSFVAFKNDGTEYEQQAADPVRYRITLAPDGKGGWVFWTLQRLDSTASPSPEEGE